MPKLFLATLATLIILCATPAAAHHIKYTYLKIGQGGGAIVYAFPSKKACEAERRKEEKFRADVYRQLTKAGTNPDKPPRIKCLDFLPQGFQRLKTGH